MPLDMSIFQRIRPVQVPDPSRRMRTMADALDMQQQQRLNDLRIQGAEADLAAEQAAMQKAAQIHEVFKRRKGNVDNDEAINEIMEIDPVFGRLVAQDFEERKNTRIEREKIARAASIQNAELMDGSMAPEISTRAPGATPMTYAGQVGEGPQFGGGTRQVDIPLPEQEILGIPELGVPGVKKRPKSAQQFVREMMEANRLKQTNELEQIRVREQAQQQYAPPQRPLAPRTVTTDQGVFTLNADGSLGQRLGGRPQPQRAEADEPLVPIIGKDGRPVYVRRSQAEGQQPASSREQGRAVTSGNAEKIADYDTSLDDLKTLRGEVPAGTTGFKAKIGAVVPNIVTEWTDFGSDAKKKQAVIDRVKQVIGKALEGGVLRKEDEVKYEKILPTIGDPAEVVKAKLDGLEKAIGQRRVTFLDALEDAGYDVGRYRSRGSSVAPPRGNRPPLSSFER